MNIFRATTATYLFWVQGKHSASICECVLFTKFVNGRGKQGGYKALNVFIKPFDETMSYSVTVPPALRVTEGAAANPGFLWVKAGLQPGPVASLSRGYIERQTAIYTCANL